MPRSWAAWSPVAATTSGGGGSSAGSEETGATEGAKAVDLASMDNAKGEVTYCTGKDTSGAQKESVKLFNEKNKSKGLSAKLLEFPESADEQRNQFIQRQEAKSGECDIFYADVVWTAEFASQKWLVDMTPYVKDRESEFIPATFETITYDGKHWGVPKQSDAGFLYYRTDQVKEPPKTWQEVYKIAAENDGIVYQGAAYEGLTCNFLEIALAAGGKMLSDDGKKADVRLAGEPQGARVHGQRDQGRRGEAVRHDLHGGAGAAGVRGRARDVRAPLAVRLRDRQGEQGRPEVRGRPVPRVRGRRQGRHPRRPQPRDLLVLEEPGRRAGADRLPHERGVGHA